MKKIERRQKIVDAGRILFATQGFEQTTMQNIADEAAIGVATVFRHFPRKELILFEIVSQLYKDQILRFEHIENLGISPLEKLNLILEAYIDYLSEENFEMTKILETFELYVAFYDVEDEVLAQIQRVFRLIPALITRILEQGQQDGSIRRNLESPKIVTTIINLFGTAIKKYSLHASTKSLASYMPAVEELYTVKDFLIEHVIKNNEKEAET